jgi:hypothetical protein
MRRFEQEIVSSCVRQTAKIASPLRAVKEKKRAGQLASI